MVTVLTIKIYRFNGEKRDVDNVELFIASVLLT